MEYSMNRGLQVTLLVSLTVLLCDVDAAEASRRRYRQKAFCCDQSRCCTAIDYADNWTCLRYKLFETTPGYYLYEADFYEGHCEVESQVVYVEAPDHGNTPSQDCPDCLEGRSCVTILRAVNMEAIPHKTKRVFGGFPDPLPGNYSPRWNPHLTVSAAVNRDIELIREGKTYKAKVYKVKSGSSRAIYVGIEVAEYAGPTGEPGLSTATARRLQGSHAYTMRYKESDMLFFTDRAD